MDPYRVIVMGGSAGALSVFRTVLSGLPHDFNAAVFVVMHLGTDVQSSLPDILQRTTDLAVVPATDRAAIRPGTVYVGVPDRHLMVHRGRLRVVRGPRENRHRPAIDPLFRSAAHAYGPRTVALLASGLLDDGSAGLIAVRRSGGIVIVQDPDDAEFPAMPSNGLRAVPADHVLPAASIAALLRDLAGKPVPALAPEIPDQEVAMAEAGFVPDTEHAGTPSPYVCPECSGTLWEIEEGDLVRFRCRVGHAYSSENMLEAKSEAAEASLWAALRSLEESAALSRRIAERVPRGNLRRRYLDDAESKQAHAATLRRVLLGFRAPLAETQPVPPEGQATGEPRSGVA